MEKDKKWLKEQIERLSYTPKGLDENNSIISKNWALYFIDQLDEQDKPVIPQFIADWYEENLSGGYTNNRNKFSGNDVFRVIQDVLKTSEGIKTWGDYDIDEKIATWAEGNEEDFIHLIVNCSYKDGYEVEKEKKYYIYDKSTNGYLGYNADKTRLSWYTSQFPNDVFTEQEIKAIDERYLVFAEEVQE